MLANLDLSENARIKLKRLPAVSNILTLRARAYFNRSCLLHLLRAGWANGFVVGETYDRAQVNIPFRCFDCAMQ